MFKNDAVNYNCIIVEPVRGDSYACVDVLLLHTLPRTHPQLQNQYMVRNYCLYLLFVLYNTCIKCGLIIMAEPAVVKKEDASRPDPRNSETWYDNPVQEDVGTGALLEGWYIFVFLK